MAMTLQELEKIRRAIICPWQWIADEALEIVTREIDQMKQDQLLSESKANPA